MVLHEAPREWLSHEALHFTRIHHGLVVLPHELSCSTMLLHENKSENKKLYEMKSNLMQWHGYPQWWCMKTARKTKIILQV